MADDATDAAALSRRLREAVDATDGRLAEGEGAELRALLDRLVAADADAFDPADLAASYEQSLDGDDRRALGQFYTPPEVVDLVTALCIESPDDVVLDPACGGGAFLAGAYDRLAELADANAAGDRSDALRDQLYGVEVERLPAAIASAALAGRVDGNSGESVSPVVTVADFFDVEPGGSAGVPAHADAVVGNPPYVRQEAIAETGRVREHLDQVAFDASLDERSDLYAYFFTHAAEFLADGGRLGLVTPAKWLSVGYGEGLRAFLLDSFRIRAVVGFARRVFDEALVPACVTVLENCDDPARRDGAVVPFVRVERSIDADELVAVLRDDHEVDRLVTADCYRVLAKRQGDLDPGGNWARFLHAPPVYRALREHPQVCQLGDLADVTYGTKPGAVDFFFPAPADLPAELPESEFFRPAIKSIRDADRIRFEPADADRLVLDVHEFVAAVLAGESDPSVDPEGAADHREAVREASLAYRDAAGGGENRDADARRLSDAEVAVTADLAARGHDALFDYVLDGVRAGYHDRATCAGRRVWFDLGPLPDAPIVTGQFVWEAAPYLYLPTPLPVSNALCYVDPAEGVDPKLLAAVLNAPATRLCMELQGRVEGGRALQVQVYERETLPVPDVREFGERDAAAAVSAFEELMAAQESDAGVEAARVELNRAVLAGVGLADRAEEVRRYADALTEARVAGKEVEQLLDGGDASGAG